MSHGPIDERQAQLVEAVALLTGPVLEDKLELERWFAGRGADLVRSTWASSPNAATARSSSSRLPRSFCSPCSHLPSRSSASRRAPWSREPCSAPPSRRSRATWPAQTCALARRCRRASVLAALDDRDLVLERARWIAEHEQAAQKYRDALARRERAEAVILAAQMRQAQAQLALVEEKLARSRITAPIAGLVVTGDLSQRLGSPVESGEMLFEIAPLDAYRVVIQVDERDIAYVQVGQTGAHGAHRPPGRADPFKVGNVTAISEQQDGRNVFRVEAEVDGTAADLRPGMEGVGKIAVGERSSSGSGRTASPTGCASRSGAGCPERRPADMSEAPFSNLWYRVAGPAAAAARTSRASAGTATAASPGTCCRTSSPGACTASRRRPTICWRGWTARARSTRSGAPHSSGSATTRRPRTS